jgi:hypothetical protein
MPQRVFQVTDAIVQLNEPSRVVLHRREDIADVGEGRKSARRLDPA